MLFNKGHIRTWLYTSEFCERKTQAETDLLASEFAAKNEIMGISGFMLTNGTSVMQMIEGEPEAILTLQTKITEDIRHKNIVSEVWELEAARAYPHWAMRVIEPANYESAFSKIESAKMETIAINIARLLFDITFDE